MLLTSARVRMRPFVTVSAHLPARVVIRATAAIFAMLFELLETDQEQGVIGTKLT